MLRKELAVIADINGREDLSKVLHGLSQVVQLAALDVIATHCR